MQIDGITFEQNQPSLLNLTIFPNPSWNFVMYWNKSNPPLSLGLYTSSQQSWYQFQRTISASDFKREKSCSSMLHVSLFKCTFLQDNCLRSQHLFEEAGGNGEENCSEKVGRRCLSRPGTLGLRQSLDSICYYHHSLWEALLQKTRNCLSGTVSQIPRFPQPQGFIFKRPIQNSLPKNRTLLSARLGFRVGEIVSVLFWTVLHKSVFWSWIF